MEGYGGDIMVESTAKKLDEVIKEHNVNIEKHDLNWCSLNLSEVLNRDKRLDASVFDIEVKHKRDTIKMTHYPIVSLDGENGLIDKAFYPNRFKRIYVNKNKGKPFYMPSQMVDIYPKAEKYLSPITKCSINDLRVKKDTLLLTRSGTIGNVTIVTDTLNGKVFSDDVIRITFKKEEDLGYVYTFLKTDIGNTILQTNGYGSVITHIEPEHLKEIIIPNAPYEIKTVIHNKVINSFKLRDQSNKLIDKAEQLMKDELKLPSVEYIKNEMNNDRKIDIFNVKLSQTNHRFDSSYHIPIVNKIIKNISREAEELTTIGDKRISKRIILAGVFKRVYVDKDYGIPFLGGKEITQLNPNIEKYLSKPHHQARYKKELKVKENWVLVTDRGTIGTVTMVPKHFEGFAVSQNVLKVVPTSNNIAGYMYIFLNSEWGKILIDREIYGSVVNMIDNNSLSCVPFPILKNKYIQDTINKLALEANKKRYEAYILEKEAINMMNEKIIGI